MSPGRSLEHHGEERCQRRHDDSECRDDHHPLPATSLPEPMSRPSRTARAPPLRRLLVVRQPGRRGTVGRAVLVGSDHRGSGARSMRVDLGDIDSPGGAAGSAHPPARIGASRTSNSSSCIGVLASKACAQSPVLSSLVGPSKSPAECQTLVQHSRPTPGMWRAARPRGEI